MEQIVKLTGRIAKVFPIAKGTSQRTGNEWTSQEYLFEFFSWSGATVPDRIVVRVFGDERIKKLNLQELEENVTLTLRFRANEVDGRGYNEISVSNVERMMAQQPQQGGGAAVAQQQTQQVAAQPAQAPQPAPQPQNQEGGKDDDLPF